MLKLAGGAGTGARSRRTLHSPLNLSDYSIECIHPHCPARMIKYTTRGRDTKAAANIALSGASISPKCQSHK
ncbi:4514_t:CDS:2, partial [Diversispora eburnea]